MISKTEFIECSRPFAPPLPLLYVTIKPDPIKCKKSVTFKVTGKLISPQITNFQIAFYNAGNSIARDGNDTVDSDSVLKVNGICEPVPRAVG